MRLLQLTLDDIRGVHLTLDPAPEGLTVFTAGTGAGKSTLREALDWALRGLAGDAVVPLDGAGRAPRVMLRGLMRGDGRVEWGWPANDVPASARAGAAAWARVLATAEPPEADRLAPHRAALTDAERADLADALDRMASLEARRRDEDTNLRALTEESRRLQKQLDETARWDGVTEAQILRADVLAEAWDSAVADQRRTEADLARASADARAAGDDPDWYARLERRAAAFDDQDRGFLERAAESTERLRAGLAEDRQVLVKATEARHALIERRHGDRAMFGAGTTLGALLGAGAASAYLFAWIPDGVLDPLTLPVSAGVGFTAMLGCGVAWLARGVAAGKRDRSLAEREEELKATMRTKAAGVVRIEMRVEELGRQVGLPEGRSLAADLARAAEVRARFGPLERAAQDAARRRQVAEEEWRSVEPSARFGDATPAEAPTLASAARAFAAGARRRLAAVREFDACTQLKSETKARLSALLADGGALVAQLQETARTLGLDDDGDMLGALHAALRGADAAVPRAAHSAGERALAALRDHLARAAADEDGWPLLLDDPLAACDDDTALTVVADLARRVAPSRQVLYFTSHAARAAQWAAVLHAAGFPCAVRPLGAPASRPAAPTNTPA